MSSFQPIHRAPLAQRRAEQESLGSPRPVRTQVAQTAALTQAAMLHLQRSVGNDAVQRLLDRSDPVQRDADDAEAGAPGLADDTFTIPLEAPDPIELPADAGPGDYPQPGDGVPDDQMVAMAMPASGESVDVQRDDDTPHPSGDLQGQDTFPIHLPPGSQPVPWSLQLTLVYRNIDVVPGEKWQFVHEPNVSIAVDLKGEVSVQSAITLINSQWVPPWKKRVEVGLGAFLQTQLLPNLSSAYGGQLQAEQHITPWFSVTVGATGTWTPARGGSAGALSVTGGLGALVHFDGFGK
jgi:hypothetical protein